MIPPIKLSAAERIINALAFVPRKRGEDFMARHAKEAEAMRPIIADVRREGVIEGLERALSCFPKPTSTTQWNPQDEIRAEIARLRKEKP